MKTLRTTWLALTLLLITLAASTAWAQDPLIINEILADPASDWNGDGSVDFKADEWVEVRNDGPDVIDLSNYYLRDDTGDEPHLQLFGLLKGGDVAVFYGSDAMAWQAANGYSTTGLSLNNGGDVVRLLRAGSGAGNLELIYLMGYQDHEAEDDRSSGWNEGMNDWQLFDAMNPYAGSLEPAGNGCPPSPGMPNVCGDTVADEAISFGEAKAVYR